MEEEDIVVNSRKILLDSHNSLGHRTNAAFTLRSHPSDASIQALCDALQNKADSVLLRHELGYILGQMKARTACPVLSAVVADETDDVIVRHECAEALGAIGDLSSIPLLTSYLSHPVREIAETCRLAIDLIQFTSSNFYFTDLDLNVFGSVDPAPSMLSSLSDEEIKSIYLDSTQPLFCRYRALFSLRNRKLGLALCSIGQSTGFSSEGHLLLHEVCFVLGQVQQIETAPFLASLVSSHGGMHVMVRHEAAEALGSIVEKLVEEDASREQYEWIMELLKRYIDEHDIFGDSCNVALETVEYWRKFMSK